MSGKGCSRDQEKVIQEYTHVENEGTDIPRIKRIVKEVLGAQLKLYSNV